jgi:hypothetical protein
MLQCNPLTLLITSAILFQYLTVEITRNFITELPQFKTNSINNRKNNTQFMETNNVLNVIFVDSVGRNSLVGFSNINRNAG